MLGQLALPLALICVVFVGADTAVEMDTPLGDADVKVVHYKNHPWTIFGNNEMKWGGIGGSDGRMMLEDYFRTFLSWLSPWQKVELKMMRDAGKPREVLIQRVAEFFDGLPISQRRNKATILLKAACHQLDVFTFGRYKAYELKKMHEIGSRTPEEMAEIKNEMVDQMVDESYKRDKFKYYNRFCKRVYIAAVQKMYPEFGTWGDSTMDSTTTNIGGMFGIGSGFPLGSSIYNTMKPDYNMMDSDNIISGSNWGSTLEKGNSEWNLGGLSNSKYNWMKTPYYNSLYDNNNVFRNSMKAYDNIYKQQPASLSGVSSGIRDGTVGDYMSSPYYRHSSSPMMMDSSMINNPYATASILYTKQPSYHNTKSSIFGGGRGGGLMD